MEDLPSISVELHPQRKSRLGKPRLKQKIDVIPNRAERSVRNLLFHRPSKPLHLEEKNQDYRRVIDPFRCNML